MSSKTRKTRKTSSTKSISSQKPEENHWVLNRKIKIVISIIGIYILLVAFFAPIVFQGSGLTPAPDMMAVIGMNKLGEEAISDGKFPLWNPTLFCGIPLFASLQYALFTYPPEYAIKLFSYIFGGTHYRIWIFHFLLAGFLALLLARHYKLGIPASWLVGVGYAFSPQLIVLIDVGHGSKLMGMVFLPLLWLLIDRLRQKPTLGRAAALGSVFAIEILALHPQVAAYGGILMGIYLLYYGISAFQKKELRQFIKVGIYWVGSLFLSLAISAVLWMSVLDYAKYSIRGAGASGVAGGGVDWLYATGWSFHPMESITYLFPSWFGFSGGSYWGTVGTPDGTPFTQNPMYFGVVFLLLAILFLVTNNRKKWGFPLALGLIAWVLSFGRYLPILYGPMFHFFPLFNKFRAPVMGQILLMLPMILLAGMGLQFFLNKVKEKKFSEKAINILLIICGIAAFKAVLIIIIPGFFNEIYKTIAGIIRPETDPRVITAAIEIARNDVIRVLGIIVLLSGLAALAAKGKIHRNFLLVVIILITIADLWSVNRKLVNFQPMRQQEILVQPEGVVKFLGKQEGKFRLHALDQRYPSIYWQNKFGIRSNTNPANWLSYFGIESTTGYFGAKPADYQKLMTVTGLDSNPLSSWNLLRAHPQLLDMLNVRYILTTVPIDGIFEEMMKRGMGEPVRPLSSYRLEFMPKEMRPGAGAFLYRNLSELPRARFVGEYRVINDLDETIREMMLQSWNPVNKVMLDRKPDFNPQSGGKISNVEIKSYKPEFIEILAEIDVPKLLILADSYYPSGWKAFIDGRETDILRANGVLRAIAVPEGRHTIQFVFKPKAFYIGLIISLVSLGGLIGWAGVVLIKKKLISVA